MRIDKNVYILGAGFSKAAKLPLINEFFQTSREIYDNPDSKLEEYIEKDFKKVLDFREEMSKSRDKVKMDLDNIEHLFSLADIANIENEKTRKELEVAIKRMIIKTLQHSQVFPSRCSISVLLNSFSYEKKQAHIAKVEELNKDAKGLTNCYDLFAMMTSGKFEEHPEQKEDIIISFNYDLVMEKYYKDIGIYPDYTIESNSKDERHKEGLEKGPKILKLHGSSNWGMMDGKLHIFDSSEAILENKDINPVIIPPTWKKGFLLSCIEEIWGSALKHLSEASRIYIIGYSLPQTDLFFKYLITAALARNDRLYKLWIINPNITPESYNRLFDTIFIERKFQNISVSFKEMILRDISNTSKLFNRFDKLS